MPFEKFINVRSRIDTPKVSIWSRGQIGFNIGASNEYSLDFNFAILYYDKVDKKIGIELTNDPTAEGAVKVTKRENAGISFSARAFLKYYKIDFSETRKYNLRYDEDNNMFIIDLKYPI